MNIIPKLVWQLVFSLRNFILGELLYQINVRAYKYHNGLEIKNIVLNKYGTLVGIDGQRIERECWYCFNQKIPGCANCTDGIYRIDFVELKRIKLGARIFHSFHQKVREAIFYEKYSLGKYTSCIDGFVKKPYLRKYSDVSMKILYAIYVLWSESWLKDLEYFLYTKEMEIRK